MEIRQINLNGADLKTDKYKMNLSGIFNFEKDVVLNDLMTDGEQYGRSKNQPKTLVLDGIIRSHKLSDFTDFNRILCGNSLKPLILTFDAFPDLIGYVEVSNRAEGNSPRHISCQLTMPDPHWYALTPQSVQLGAQYSTGVVFGSGGGVSWKRKNILNPTAGTVTGSGVTCTVAADGTITLNGTATAGVWFQLSPILKAGLTANSNPIMKFQSGLKYTLSHTVLSGSKSGSMKYDVFDTAGTAYPSNYLVDIQDYGSPYTFTAGSNGSLSNSLTAGMFYLIISSGAVFNNYTFRLQMEQNSTATSWLRYGYSETGVVFGTATGEGGTLTNNGNSDAYPKITIIGTCSGITVTNQTTGESISVNVSLKDSDVLIIDCNPKTRGVYLNGVQSLGLKSGAGWIHCPPGDNVFSFSRSSLQNKKHCTVELQSRWI